MCYSISTVFGPLTVTRWGIGVALGVYVCGGAGGHLNPAITLVNCLYRGFPWWKLPVYACAQVLGCFCGAAIIYGNYKSAIDVYEGGSNIRTVPGYSPTATAGGKYLLTPSLDEYPSSCMVESIADVFFV